MICKFCNKDKELRESHIIPKFVFRWLKKTGGEYFRKAENPNKRPQDGYKPRLLCHQCEQTFSKWEDRFAKEIFYPFSDKNIEQFIYDDNLIKFAISVLYRVITVSLQDNKDNVHYKHFEEAEKEWKSFLKNKSELYNFNKIHFFFTSNKFKNQQQPVERFLNYYARGVDAALVSDTKTALVYAKLARVILIGEIKGFDNQGMINTLIDCQKGTLIKPEMKLNLQIKQFLIERVTQLNILFDRVSDNQKNKAIKYTEKSIEKTDYSDIRDIVNRDNVYTINSNLIDFE